VWKFNENAIKFYESLGMKTKNRRLEFNYSAEELRELNRN